MVKWCSALLALLLAGCSSGTLVVEPREIEVPVPVILVDSVFVQSPAPTEEVVQLRKSLDSAITELENRPFTMTPQVSVKPRLREYEGRYVTERRDSVWAKFHLAYPVPYFDFAVHYANVKASFPDTTFVPAPVNEYSFWEKLGFAVMFLVIGSIVGGLIMLFVPIRGSIAR